MKACHTLYTNVHATIKAKDRSQDSFLIQSDL